MERVLRTQGVSLGELTAQTREILREIDRGDHDAALAAAGVVRDPAVRLEEGVTLTTGQGLSPDQWQDIAVDFAPFAAAVATSIWEIIVVPALKHVFREDRIKSEADED